MYTSLPALPGSCSRGVEPWVSDFGADGCGSPPFVLLPEPYMNPNPKPQTLNPKPPFVLLPEPYMNPQLELSASRGVVNNPTSFEVGMDF